MGVKGWLLNGEEKSCETGKKRNRRLLSFDAVDVFEDTFSLTDTRPGSPCKLSYVPISIILLLIVIIVLLPVFNHKLALNPAVEAEYGPPAECLDPCEISLVESIPQGLVFNTSTRRTSTYAAWKELTGLAKQSIELAGMYWTLRGKDVYEDPSASEGEDIYRTLKTVVRANKLSLRIAQNQPRPDMPNLDTKELEQEGLAEVRSLNFSRLMGAGVLHTKLWLVDRKHFYVGSANFDWRSLTQVKEVGVLVKNCPCLADDMAKIWEVYWRLGSAGAVVPDSWPSDLSTNINMNTPIPIISQNLKVSMSSSPPPFCPKGRDTDVDAIVRIIDGAKRVVRVAVMDYFPATIYTDKPSFWPVIDDALRRAAVERDVKVELLMSEWDHTRPSMKNYLRSLQALDGLTNRTHIRVRLFKVPSFTPEQKKIPFGRVNHNKYLVTESLGFLGTSNWSADYFISTGGIGFVFSGSLRDDLEDIFIRDWNSAYAADLS